MIQAVFQDFKHGVPSGRELFQPFQGPNHSATYQLIVVIALGGTNWIYCRAQISVT